MVFTSGLERFLFEVSSWLYVPVVTGVSVLTFYVAWLIGEVAADGLRRLRSGSRELASFRLELESELRSREPHLEVRLERLLRARELAVARSLDRVRFVIKVGPALGLMGTLIPMGISLAALAQGDVPKMAGSMVTAFTATVAGLGCGVAAYLIALVREKWARADVLEMQFLTETRARDAGAAQEENRIALPHATQPI